MERRTRRQMIHRCIQAALAGLGVALLATLGLAACGEAAEDAALTYEAADYGTDTWLSRTIMSAVPFQLGSPMSPFNKPPYSTLITKQPASISFSPSQMQGGLGEITVTLFPRLHQPRATHLSLTLRNDLDPDKPRDVTIAIPGENCRAFLVGKQQRVECKIIDTAFRAFPCAETHTDGCPATNDLPMSSRPHKWLLTGLAEWDYDLASYQPLELTGWQLTFDTRKTATDRNHPYYRVWLPKLTLPKTKQEASVVRTFVHTPIMLQENGTIYLQITNRYRTAGLSNLDLSKSTLRLRAKSSSGSTAELVIPLAKHLNKNGTYYDLGSSLRDNILVEIDMAQVLKTQQAFPLISSGGIWDLEILTRGSPKPLYFDVDLNFDPLPSSGR